MQESKLASSFTSDEVLSSGIVNGRFVMETTGRFPGTLVCEPAGTDDGDDITITRLGKRFMDDGTFTARV